MKTIKKVQAFCAVVLFSVAMDVMALPLLSGEIGMFGVFNPVDNAWGATDISVATGIDFDPNQFKVVSATDSFSSIAIGTLGDIKDFQFDPGLGINDGFDGVTSVTSIDSFWSVVDSSLIPRTFAFDLLSIAEGFTSDPLTKLVLEGTGIMSADGFVDTLGTWTFTGQTTSAGGVFTWSAGSVASASVPEPSLLTLLGIGLIGFASRKIRRVF